MQKNYLFKAWAAVLMICLAASVKAETGTLTFGKDAVEINAATVTATDNLGNTWTITTQGDNFYHAAQSGYYQVGTASQPATSMTFTTTLPSAQTITAFSAKFGGFSKNSSGNVSLKVGETEVGTGSFSESNDVTVTNNTQATGTVLTINVTITNRLKVYNLSYTYSSTQGDGGSTTPTKQTATLSFPETSYTAYVDEVFDLPTATANYNGASITYSMETNSAYDFDATRHQLLCGTVGTYTLTASVAETESYTAATATTTINVVNKPSIPAGGYTYQLVTSQNEIEDGGVYIIVNNAKTGALSDASKNRFNSADVTVSDNLITVQDINQAGSPYEVTLNAASTSGKYYLNLSNGNYIGNGTSSNYLKSYTSSQSGTEWTISINNADKAIIGAEYGEVTHYIMYNATVTNDKPLADPWGSYKQETSPNILYPYLYKKVTPSYDYTRTVTSGDYGTICLPNAVEASGRAGATFYSVAGINCTTLQLTEETGTLEAGKPYLFQATGNVLTCVYTGEAVAAPVTDSYLVGTFTETTVPTGNNFVLQKQDGVMGFYKVETTQPTLGANRAYLVYEAPAGVKGLTFGTATGIATVNGQQSTANRPIYNLQGQRVSQATKGIFIINGKKVIK